MNLGQKLLLRRNMQRLFRSPSREEGKHAQPQDGQGSNDGLRTDRAADGSGSVAEFPLDLLDEGGPGGAGSPHSGGR